LKFLEPFPPCYYFALMFKMGEKEILFILFKMIFLEKPDFYAIFIVAVFSTMGISR
jgi:hypothetical protein